MLTNDLFAGMTLHIHIPTHIGVFRRTQYNSLRIRVTSPRKKKIPHLVDLLMTVVIPNITMSRTDEHVYADYYNVYFGRMEEAYGCNAYV